MTRPQIVTADMLRAWRGTDAELARSLDVDQSAITRARQRHGVPRVTSGKPLSRTVIKAIVREATRRGVTVLRVLADLGVWAESDDGLEVDHAAPLTPTATSPTLVTRSTTTTPESAGDPTTIRACTCATPATGVHRRTGRTTMSPTMRGSR